MIAHFKLPLLAGGIVAALFVAIADNAPESWWQSIVQTGAIGGVLVWFMYWGQRILRENTRALNLNTLSTACAVLALEHIDEATRALAAKIKADAESELNEPSEAPPRRGR